MGNQICPESSAGKQWDHEHQMAGASEQGQYPPAQTFHIFFQGLPSLYAKSSYRFFSELEIALIRFCSLKNEYDFIPVEDVAQAKRGSPNGTKKIYGVYDPVMSLGKCQ
jgi:hypothetical protein